MADKQISALSAVTLATYDNILFMRQGTTDKQSTVGKLRVPLGIDQAIINAGLTPSEADNAQLAAAIVALAKTASRPQWVTPVEIPGMTAASPFTATTWTTIDCSSIVAAGIETIYCNFMADETVIGDDTVTLNVRQDSGGKGLQSHRLVAGNPSSGIVEHDGSLMIPLTTARAFQAMMNNTGEECIGKFLMYFP